MATHHNTDHRAGSNIVTSLERAYGEMRRQVPELPPVVIVTGTGARGRLQVHGHLAPSRWKTDGNGGEMVHELHMAGESLARSADEVFTTLAHEAAHALAAARGVKDTSRGGRYHNRKFVDTAAELDLAWPAGAEPHGTIGFSAVVLTEHGAEVRWRKVIERLAADMKAWRAPEAVKAAKRTLSVRLECSCNRILRVSRKVADEGAILCGECSGPFLEDEAGDDEDEGE